MGDRTVGGDIPVHKGRIHETWRPESQGTQIQGRGDTGCSYGNVKVGHGLEDSRNG